MSNRIEHIDIAKGISISLVALWHSNVKVFFPELIEPMSLFRMPLFFFLSGVFFSYSQGLNGFLLKKTDALLKPYFATLLGLLFLSAIMNEKHLFWQFKGIFYGNGDTIVWPWKPLWFLTHLFALYCFAYVIYRYTNFENLSLYIKCSILLLGIFLGSWVMDVFWYIDVTMLNKTIELPGLPFSLDIILVSSAFFIAGKTVRDKVVNFTPNDVLTVFSFLGFLSVAVFSDAYIDLNKRVLINPGFAMIGSMCGIYIVIRVACFINNIDGLKKPFLAMGNGSLFILIFHASIYDNIYDSLVNYIEIDELVIFLSVVAFFASVTLPLLIKWLALRNDVIALLYLPVQSNRLWNRMREAYR